MARFNNSTGAWLTPSGTIVPSLAISLAVWVFPGNDFDDIGSYARIIEFGSGKAISFNVLDTSEKPRLERTWPNNDQMIWASDVTGIPVDQTWNSWIFACEDLDSNTRPKLYINGVDESISEIKDDGPSGDPITSAQTVRLMNRFDSGGNRPVDGYIAWITVWNVKLTQNEATAFHNGWIPTRGLIHCWPMWGNSDPEPDIVGGQHATISGTVTGHQFMPAIVPRIFFPAPDFMQPAGAGGGETITATSLTITPTLNAAQIDVTIPAASLTLTPTLNSATLTATRSLPATALTITPTLNAAQLDRTLNAAVLSIAPTLQAATLSWGQFVSATSLSITPSLPSAQLDRTLPAASLNLAPTLNAATMSPTYAVPAASLTLTPTLPSAQLDRTLNAAALTLAPTLNNATLTTGTTIPATTLNLTPTLNAAQLDRTLNAAALTLTPTLNAAQLDRTLNATALTIAPTLNAAQIDLTLNATTLTLTPTLAAAQIDRTLTAATLTITPTLNAATVSTGTVLQAVVLTLTPTLNTAQIDRTLNAALLDISPTLGTPGLAATYTITADTLTVSVQLPSATVSASIALTATLLDLTPTLTLATVTLTSGVSIPAVILDLTPTLNPATVMGTAWRTVIIVGDDASVRTIASSDDSTRVIVGHDGSVRLIDGSIDDMSRRSDQVIARYEDVTFRVTLAAGTDLSAWEADFTVRETEAEEDTATAVIAKTEADAEVTIDDANDRIDCKLTSALSGALLPRTYYWDLWRTDTGNKTRLNHGDLVVEQGGVRA